MNDDAMLTAYALGQLDDADRRAVEARLAGDPQLQDELDAIQDMGALLGDALAAESALELTAEQRAAIAARAGAHDGGAADEKSTTPEKPVSAAIPAPGPT